MNESSPTLFDTSPPQPEDNRPVVFIDRTLTSAKLAAHLNAFREWRIELHHSWFQGNCPDPVWIRDCAKKGWILLSGDKEIRRSPENVEAVRQSKAQLFYYNPKNKRVEDYMGILATARHRILRLAKNNRGPFFASIDASANVRLVGEECTSSVGRTRRKFVSGEAFSTRNPQKGRATT
jgi:hypothetical protein